MNPGDEQGYDTDERYGGTGQTRTRLPGDEDTYDTARRSMRPSRSLITVVGVVVLLIAAIAFANQNTDTPDNPSDARGPAASPTSPTGTKPVDTQTSGIPTGHPQTKQGAESAAANYAVALGSAEMFGEERRSQILETIIVPSEVQRFRDSLDQAYSKPLFQNLGLREDGSSPEGLTFVSRTTPIGTTAAKYTDTKATLSVWCSGLLGMAGETSTNPVTSSWFTITMELHWVDGDWKIFTHSQKDGPAPVPGDERAATSEEIAKAVEGYGGLTYAR
ncbi:hypothetical protein AB0F32_30750 [Streptomyces albidoflavus]|uniref:Uncharacterized protein n=1 Tax=Streptomyces albidoflavus TaxID=1886 RepID=A0A8G1ZS52_9ACTN|nr:MULTISPECIES: hypothetical protein [Streptomyces]MYX50220.1 hypothetical protein [Streptomyces sp. SID8385]KUL66054.1 hypothetical protein ADL32_05790 [Streptomyces albidoflavus]MCL6281815.1 hypothetical protein [Streptomyces albidoflavus]MCO6695346.1 hypothetical protein [Streptomyces sp. Vc17.3-30]MCX4465295.1 hypothetical protein [Streptomyces albidoflavus]